MGKTPDINRMYRISSWQLIASDMFDNNVLHNDNKE